MGTDVGLSPAGVSEVVDEQAPTANSIATLAAIPTRRTIRSILTLRKVTEVTTKQGQVVASGAFQLFGQRKREQVSELLTDVFGRDDVEALGADWRGIVYFTVADDEEISDDSVLGFDASSGDSGELATVEEVLAAIRSGEIAEAVNVASFDAWRDATGTHTIDMGACVPPTLYEFLGGNPAERSTETEDLVTFIAVAAALMGRLEQLGVQPGDEIPDEVFDDERWRDG